MEVATTTTTGNSEYYNTRGDTAKMYQAYLNTQGEKLNVDGIWGKKTEAAYQRNKDAFEAWLKGGGTDSAGGTGTGTSAPTTIAGINSSDLSGLMSQYQQPTYSAKSDDELRKEAEAMYETKYNADKLAAEQKNDAYQLAIQQQIDALTSALGKSQQDTQKSYEQTGNRLQRLLTARGMGRSTYAGDVAQRNASNMQKALSELLTDYQSKTGQLAQQGAQYRQQTADTLAQLLKDKQTNIDNYLYQLQGREYDRTTSTQDRYNSLVSSLQQMLNSNSLSQQQMELDKLLKEMQLAAALAGAS